MGCLVLAGHRDMGEGDVVLQPVTPVPQRLRQDDDPELAVSLGYRVWLCFKKKKSKTNLTSQYGHMWLSSLECQFVLPQGRHCPTQGWRTFI